MREFLATIGPFVLGIACAAASAQCPPGAVQEEAIRERVAAALHSDQYFYDKHVTVSMEHGDVVLRGLVFGDWDLRDALRIATTAACNRRVIDELKIVVGGRR
jgi:osmotically-inducible protein OsmY